MKETELAAKVLSFLHAEGWETWQEVTLPDGGRADIVARSRPCFWIIETKTRMSLDLIEQGFARAKYAHLVSVAVPVSRNRSSFVRRILGIEGIGLLEAHEDRGPYYDSGVVQTRRAKLHRSVITTWTESLCDEHKTSLAAGSKAGGQWTPFRQTCAEARRYVARRPGCTLKDLFDEIPHHYHGLTSARGAFVKRIEEGVVEGIELRKQGRVWTLWPKGKPSK